jgi:protein gp37
MHIDWVREISDQCTTQSVPFFLRQRGGLRPKARRRIFDGREWNGLQQETASLAARLPYHARPAWFA